MKSLFGSSALVLVEVKKTINIMKPKKMLSLKKDVDFLCIFPLEAIKIMAGLRLFMKLNTILALRLNQSTGSLSQALDITQTQSVLPNGIRMMISLFSFNFLSNIMSVSLQNHHQPNSIANRKKRSKLSESH